MAPDQITGIDISTTAVELCDRLYKENNLNFIVGDSENIPSQDESMDVVINVESSHCYGSVDLFLSEVKRVLKPGGHFLFCDLRPAEKLDLLNNQFNVSGLELLKKKDITGNVILALEKMSDFRKNAIRAKVPRIIQNVFESYAGVKGSRTYESFADGSLAYLSAVFQKPA
jgi:ubiquinone/menaquinone biosynthesis C-methylase UbiE